MRPNILFITAHDVGRHLNCYGVRTVHTPNLDALARGGALLSNCFCVAPQCSPSRAAMVTGRYPHNNGVLGLTHDGFGWDMNHDEKHIARLLRDAGYHTALGTFQHEYRRPDAEMGFAESLHCRGDAGRVGDGIGAWLGARRGAPQPFYLQLAFFEPHRIAPGDTFGHPSDEENGVFIPPFEQDDPSSRTEFARFQGAIRALDEGVGKVLQALDAAGLSQNTLVLFAADHGIPFPRAKCSLYDPGLEIAALWRLPQTIAAGQNVAGLRSNLDFLPTLLDLCRIPVPANVQGHTFAEALRGRAVGGRSEIFAEMTYHDYCDPVRCVRTADYKLIVNFSSAPSFMDSSQSWRPLTTPRAVPNPPFSYHPAVEVYDLREDPLESRNLYRQQTVTEIQAGLMQQLNHWMQATRDPLLQGIPTSPMYDEAMRALKSSS